MSDNALRNAEAKRDALAKEIEALGLRLSGLRDSHSRVSAFIEQWHEFAGTPLPDIHTSDTDGERDRVVIKNPDRKYVAQEAARLIRMVGAPMNRTELFQALARSGIKITGKEPEMVLSTMLWRTPETIVRLPSFGYWPQEDPYPPANYIPGQKSVDPEEIQMLAEDFAGTLPDEETGERGKGVFD